MSDKLVIEELFKIFGPHPDEARRLLEQGWGKADIFEQTRTTIGVQNVNLAIREGETFVVMGLSGSGKSTLVRMLNRLIEPTSGHIYIGGHDITAMRRKELIDLRRRDMTMVFQSFALMPHRTVLENACFGLEVAGIPREERHERALRALEQVGLKANAHSLPSELSGGMQQRVGLARALATEPTVLLMDEAFSALDPLIRTEMQDELMGLQQDNPRTIVFISHDLDEAIRIGDRIAIMQEGAVIQVGTPAEIVANPANEYVRSFFYGVDVSKVFDAGHIARDEVGLVIEPSQVSVRDALRHLRERDERTAMVVEHGRFRGLVDRDSLQRETERSGEDRYEGAFLSEVEPIEAGLPLSEVISRLAQSELPVPVVDRHGRYIGAISHTIMLQALDRGGEGAAEMEPEGPAGENEAGTG